MNRREFLQSIPMMAVLPLLFRQKKNLVDTLLIDPNELICKRKFDLAQSLHLDQKPINEVIIEIAKSFIGVEYAADTLETTGPEHLVINLQTLDCVTFYENSLVLARCIKKHALTFEEYKKELQFVRYRGGVINAYPSRLHYTSDYFYDNEKKSVLKDMSKELGGVPYKKKINFMSTHSGSYMQLKNNPEFIKNIVACEEEINKRTLYHIPKAKVQKTASLIQSGDIIGITTSLEGLDCTHTGIALWQNKQLHMIHAPIPGEQVQITKLPLGEYLKKIKKDLGIMVARPLEPKL